MRAWVIFAAAGLLLTLAVVGPGRALSERAAPDPSAMFESPTALVAPATTRTNAPLARTPLATPPATATQATPRRALLPRWRVVGKVQLEDGSPAPRAKVVLGRKQGIADMLGNFTLLVSEDITPDAPLRARFEGHAVTRVADFGARLLALDPKVPVGPITLTVGAKLPMLQGIVVDASGRPQKGWRVFARIPDPAPDHHDADLLLFVDGTRSDRDGRFQLPAAGLGRNVVQTHRGALRIDHVIEVDSRGSDDLRLVVPAVGR